MNTGTYVNFYRSLGARLLTILTFLVISNPVFAQCTTSAWSSVTGSPSALGSSTNPQGKKYEQNCGLTIDVTSVPAYVTSSDPSDEAAISVRFYILQETLDIQSGPLTLLTARNGGTIQFQLLIRSTGSVNHLVSVYRHNGSLVEVSQPDWVALQNVWQAVEVAWSAGAGDGTFELKVDDIPMVSRASLTNGGAIVNEVDIGVVNSPTATGDLVLDAVELRRAGESGLLDISELRNISTRADVRTADERVIGGFIVEGDTDKCVVVRGRGPSVEVSEEIRNANPTLRLMMGAIEIATNDDWQDDPIQEEIITNLGLAPGNALDAAIHACVPPGPYTAILSTTGGLANIGVGIVEVYDADVGTPYLGNISTRARVDAGDLRAIGGFIVEGTEPKQVLIRARGPTVGVAEELRLPNPNVRLFDINGEIAANNNWGDAGNAVEITNTGLAPTDPNESAILMMLDPGAYTAIVNGIGGSGIGIVEVYDLSGGHVASQ